MIVSLIINLFPWREPNVCYFVTRFLDLFRYHSLLIYFHEEISWSISVSLIINLFSYGRDFLIYFQSISVSLIIDLFYLFPYHSLLIYFPYGRDFLIYFRSISVSLIINLFPWRDFWIYFRIEEISGSISVSLLIYLEEISGSISVSLIINLFPYHSLLIYFRITHY